MIQIRFISNQQDRRVVLIISSAMDGLRLSSQLTSVVKRLTIADAVHDHIRICFYRELFQILRAALNIMFLVNYLEKNKAFAYFFINFLQLFLSYPLLLYSCKIELNLFSNVYIAVEEGNASPLTLSKVKMFFPP